MRVAGRRHLQRGGQPARHPNGAGDAAYLFKSQDLRRWQFVDTFYQSCREWTEADEDCAVPDFFPLGDRHMLLFCSHLQATQYYLGELRGERFHPRVHDRMSWEGGQLGGPRTLLDASGRRIFFDWVREIRGPDRERAAGWSGVMTLPRILGLAADGTLTIEPVPEVERLRYRHRRRQSLAVADGADTVVAGIAGDTCELALEIDPGEAAEVGVAVRCSPGGEEQTPVTAQEAPFSLTAGEPLRLCLCPGPVAAGGVRQRPPVRDPAHLSDPRRRRRGPAAGPRRRGHAAPAGWTPGSWLRPIGEPLHARSTIPFATTIYPHSHDSRPGPCRRPSPETQLVPKLRFVAETRAAQLSDTAASTAARPCTSHNRSTSTLWGPCCPSA